MKTSYDQDVVAWANEQAALLRSGQFSELDIAHLAEEIEDVGKSEKRELASRMAVLLAHLLKWQFQPEKRSRSWMATIRTQRASSTKRLKVTPSLQPMLTDPVWIDNMWADAVAQATKETEIDNFPEDCPWSMADVLTEGWLPPDLH